MSEQPLDNDLYQRTRSLLEPGEIELVGMIVYTDFDGSEEPALHQATLEIGDTIAEYATDEETYVYSGNDDADFGVNQHQGLTIDGDEFVWECQQLFREGQYAVVFYYEADLEQESLLADLRELGYEVDGVTSP